MCTDIDECNEDHLADCSIGKDLIVSSHILNCDTGVTCVNTIGSYNCDGCLAGYVGSGNTCAG